MVLHWTIVELAQIISIFGSNNKLLNLRYWIITLLCKLSNVAYWSCVSWSNNILFNPKMEIICASSTIVQYNNYFNKKVLNYFEVMINYIIAVTLHARRNNLMTFCSYQLPFSQMILLLSWIHIGLILCSQPLLNSNTLHQAGWVWFALAPV